MTDEKRDDFDPATATTTEWRKGYVETLELAAGEGADPDTVASAMLEAAICAKEAIHGTLPTARHLLAVARAMVEKARPEQAGGPPTAH